MRVSHGRLRETAADRWDLSGTPRISASARDWLTASDVFEPSQGVTPGGPGVLDLVLMPRAAADRLKLDEALLQPVIKSREVTKWHLARPDQVLLYPYQITKNSSGTRFCPENVPG